MIFRDDDISHTTDIALFKRVHKYFKDAVMMHTIALIVKDIETNPKLVEYIKRENIDVQIHCFTHYKLTEDIEQAELDIPLCIETIEKLFGERPTVLYPPWNNTTEELNELAESFGLKVSTKKISLDQYLRCDGEVDEEVINFHYWAQQETILLEPALKLYNSKR